MGLNGPKPPRILRGQYAGLVSRLIAFVIDILIVVAAFVVIGGIVDLLLRFFGLRELVTELFNFLLRSNSTVGNILRIIALFSSTAFITFLYIILMWTLTSGSSVGKWVMGVRIARLNGRRMTLLISLKRYLAFWLAALPLGLGLLWVLVDDRRQGWHDKIARTCVIYDWQAREDERFLRSIKERLDILRRTRKPLPNPSEKESAGRGG